MISPSILCLRDKISLELKQDTLAKILQNPLFLTRRRVVGLPNLVAPIVEGVIMVSSYPARMVGFTVGKMGIK